VRSAGGDLPTDFTFTGQRGEAAIGLIDYHARWYSPRLGRFVSADTIAPGVGGASLNRYMYVKGNLLGYIDPSGHICISIDDRRCASDFPVNTGGAGIQIDVGLMAVIVGVDVTVNVLGFTANEDFDVGISGDIQLGFGFGASAAVGPHWTNATNPEEYQQIDTSLGFSVADDAVLTVLGFEYDQGHSLSDWDQGPRSHFVGFFGFGEEVSAWIGKEFVSLHLTSTGFHVSLLGFEKDIAYPWR